MFHLITEKGMGFDFYEIVVRFDKFIKSYFECYKKNLYQHNWYLAHNWYSVKSLFKWMKE